MAMAMACSRVSVMVTEKLWLYRVSPKPKGTLLSAAPSSSNSNSIISLSLSCTRTSTRFQFNCSPSHDDIDNLSSSSTDTHQQLEVEVEPPQEAVLKLISEVSKTEGRVGQTTNMVLGGTVTHDSTNEWLALDQKVNTYPTVRGFTAIGTGGDDFVQAMIIAVESVVQRPIPQGHVKQKMSSGGKYVSVNIGPVQVVSSEQVQAVYNAMRRDDRMKYFL